MLSNLAMPAAESTRIRKGQTIILIFVGIELDTVALEPTGQATQLQSA